MTWGIPVLLLSKKTLPVPNPWFRSQTGFLAFLFFAGSITLSAIATWWHLLLALKFYHLLGLTALLILILGIFYFKKSVAALSPLLRGIPHRTPFRYGEAAYCLVGLLLLLTLSSLQTVNPDTQIYHLQIIQWSSAYPAVPGLANIFLRLGLGSAWFSLTSFFYLPGFHNENFTYLNVTMAIWFFLWLFSQWNYHFSRIQNSQNSRLLCLFYFLLLNYSILDWEMLRNAANSANYDSIVMVCTLAGLCFLIEQLLSTPEKKPGFSILFVALIISSITFKLSGIFSLLLVVFYFFHNRPTKQQVCLTLLAALLLILPVLVKNYIISGYPLFPFALSVGSPDWKVPKDLLIHLSRYIAYTNRLQSFDVDIAGSVWNNLNWIPHWFPLQYWSQRLLLLLSLSSIVLFFTGTRFNIDHRRLRKLLTALFLMLLAWLLTAPSPRFALAPLFVTAILPLCFVLYNKIKPGWYNFSFLLVTFVCCAYLATKANSLIRSPQFLLHPPNAETAPYQAVTIKGIDFHLVERMHNNIDNRCYDTPLPCICQENPYLQPRGDSIRSGFKMTPYPDSAFIQNYKY